ncbi:MAG: DUF2975 domain-containing protein [Actinomycetota bacterium]|nr:DUF2975 domain-containing protein [Actinomycetota bacterium]
MDPMPSRAARTAYLVLTVIFWITVVAGLILVAHRLFGLLQDSQTLTVPASAAIDDVRLPEAFEIAGPLPVNVDIADPSLTQRVIATVPPFVWWALALGVLWLLRKVARSAVQGDPFQRANVARLRWVGALFLLGFPLATIVEGYFTDWLFSAGVWTGGPLPPGGIRTEFPVVSGPAIMAAVSLFALAEVFAYGARLREDVDATI